MQSTAILKRPLILVIACAAPAPACAAAAQSAGGAGVVADTLTPALASLAESYRVAAITEREFTHADLWGAIGPIIENAPALDRELIGRSVNGRPIYRVRYGAGDTRVLLWSQMHGDESTATMALADIIRFLAERPEHPLARRLARELTVVAVPMLNPDGAARFERRNALGIDINRDARALSTPEARALKDLQERFDPDFGFNLHDQNVRTRVGSSERLAAIALLAPSYNAERAVNAVRRRAMRLSSVIREAIEPLVGGHITRYSAEFYPRAFGDLMTKWGVSTVLIESGGWTGDPEKQYLRKVNVVAILAALDAIATGSYREADPSYYLELPRNGGSVDDLLVLGGRIVLPEAEAPYRADLSVNYTKPLEWRGGYIEAVGDLRELSARDTIDASGLFIHMAPEAIDATDAGNPVLRIGAPAAFVIRRGASPESEAVWVVDGRAPEWMGEAASTE